MKKKGFWHFYIKEEEVSFYEMISKDIVEQQYYYLVFNWSSLKNELVKLKKKV